MKKRYVVVVTSREIGEFEVEAFSKKEALRVIATGDGPMVAAPASDKSLQ